MFRSTGYSRVSVLSLSHRWLGRCHLSQISIFVSRIVRGVLANTSDLTKPHRNKLQSIIPHDLAGCCWSLFATRSNAAGDFSCDCVERTVTRRYVLKHFFAREGQIKGALLNHGQSRNWRQKSRILTNVIGPMRKWWLVNACIASEEGHIHVIVFHT